MSICMAGAALGEQGPESLRECSGPSRCLPTPEQPWGCGEAWRDLSALFVACNRGFKDRENSYRGG